MWWLSELSLSRLSPSCVLLLLSTNLDKQTGSTSISPIPESWVPTQVWVVGAAKEEIEWHEAYSRMSETRKSVAIEMPETRGCMDILDTFVPSVGQIPVTLSQ